MTDGKAGSLQRQLMLARICIPVVGILLVVLQWWQNSQLMDEARAASNTMRQIWMDHPPAFPLDTLAAALYVPTAVSPLGAFDTGDGAWLAQTIWMQLTRVARAQDQLGYDIFPAGRQIGLTAAMFAQYIIPCLAIWLGWVQRRSKPENNLQSWISLQTQLVEFGGLLVAVCCLLTALLQRQSLGLEGALRLMLILGAYLIYSLTAGTLSWLAFQKMPSLPRAVGVLVLFWLFNFTLARPLTVNLAAALFPLPTLDEYARRLDEEVQRGYGGVESRSDRQRRFYAEILRDYKVSDPKDVPVNFSALVLQREERHYREVGFRMRARLEETFHRQERLEQALAVLFPLVAIQLSSSALAGTDYKSERGQLAEADRFWDSVVNKVYADVAVSSGPNAERVQRGSDYWSQFPFLELRISSPAWALSACWLPVGGMLAWAGGGLLLALRRPKRTMGVEAA
jgi:hypothetical protein